MSSNTKITNQLKAIIVFEYFNLYNKLEDIVRMHFEECLNGLPDEKINELYFLSGGLIGTYVEYNHPMALKLKENTFKPNSKFKELNTNQILKINRKNKFITSLKSTIDSAQNKMSVFTIEDCIIKLLEMRNVLAHKILNCSFKSKHRIELLSLSKMNQLNYNFLEGYDLKLLDDMSKDILSNYFYMEKIITVLEVKNSN